MSANQLILTIVVALVALAVRLPGLGSFMTADEQVWLLRSGEFYDKLFEQRDPGGTFMTTHPGATLMWVAGAAIQIQEARLGEKVDEGTIGQFRSAALWPVVILVAVLIGIAAWFLQRLFGTAAGVAGGVLLALEPYFAGMSQIVHVDMLLALFMLNSVLAFLQKRKIPAGIFAGLAMATKLLPAVWLFVFFGLVFLYQYRLQLGEIVRRFGFIVGVSLLTFYAVWPALWVKDDILRSFEKDVPAIVQDAHVEFEVSKEPIPPASFYARALLGRTTPFAFILTGAALLTFLPLRRGGGLRSRPEGWLLLYALGFLIMISLVAKKADRYALPALVVLPVIAGWALAQVPFLHTRSVKVGISALLLAQVVMWSPYAIAYGNPLWNIRPLSQQGWGEGLDEAARWLNRHPLAEEMHVASWYPSVFTQYFSGQTFSLSSRYDERTAFVVTYRNMGGRAPDDIATNVLDEFLDQKPAHVVEIMGKPYVWIYNKMGLNYFPNHIGELTGEASVGQIVAVDENNWSAIEIGMATFSSRRNSQEVILHVRESLESREDLRTTRVNASEIQDSAFHLFEFEPIKDSAGKEFYIYLESSASTPGDAVTVRFANHDLVPGEMVKGGRQLTGRDIAYRLPGR